MTLTKNLETLLAEAYAADADADAYADAAKAAKLITL